MDRIPHTFSGYFPDTNILKPPNPARKILAFKSALKKMAS